MDLDLIVDSKQVLNKIKLFEGSYKIYTVDLNDSGGRSYIIYPFEISFYQYLIDRKKYNFTNESLADYNSILFSGIINRLLSIIELEDPTLVKSKIGSIFYILIKWLKDCVHEFKFPEAFNFKNSNLIICKYCLKQFIKDVDNNFIGTSNCLCNRICSNDYTKFLNDELVHCILYSEIEVGLLYNAASRMIVNMGDLSCEDDLNKSKLYLQASIQAISEHFLKRIKKKRPLFSIENYKTYENELNVNLMQSKTYTKETKLLNEYKEAYSQGNNQKINDLLNERNLPIFKKLRAIDKEVSPRVQSQYIRKQP